MQKLNIGQLEQLITTAGMRVKPVKKELEYQGQTFEVVGFELYEDGELTATFASMDGVARTFYHDDGEVTKHTTFWQIKGWTFDMVMQAAATSALDVLRKRI